MDPTIVQYIFYGVAIVSAAAVYFHLGTKVAVKLDAQAGLATTNHYVALFEHGGAAVARALEGFAAANQKDIAALADPMSRAASLQHLEGAARNGADPLLKSAFDEFGPSWLKGAADKFIDSKLAPVAK